MTTLYMVFYDDESGLCVPMGWDPDCEGALCGTGSAAVVFANKKAAQQAIRVSRAWYRLQHDRGDKRIYDDFSPEYVKRIKIIPVTVIGGEVVMKQEDVE